MWPKTNNLNDRSRVLEHWTLPSQQHYCLCSTTWHSAVSYTNQPRPWGQFEFPWESMRASKTTHNIVTFCSPDTTLQISDCSWLSSAGGGIERERQTERLAGCKARGKPLLPPSSRSGERLNLKPICFTSATLLYHNQKLEGDGLHSKREKEREGEKKEGERKRWPRATVGEWSVCDKPKETLNSWGHLGTGWNGKVSDLIWTHTH